MKAVHLKTEYLSDPIGIDIPEPLMSWNCETGICQTAYRVIARNEEEKTVFDTQKQSGSKMHCRYLGCHLQSREQISWKVCLWDENDRACWSEPATFEMGLLAREDWKARWICGIDTDKRERLPADCYRRDFMVSRQVRKARLYATSHGVYAAYINGKRLPGVLAPGCTEYPKRLYYQTYDVTGFLQSRNRLEFMVADGWYKGKIGSDNTEYFSGIQLKLLAQLEIEYENGDRETIASDDSFLWSNDGPVRFADLKDGIMYDARCVPGYCHHALFADESTIPSASNAPVIAEHECFSPVLECSPSGRNILNFKQNLAGYVRFRIHGHEGQKVTLNLFESKENGEYSDRTITGRCKNLQKIEYICSGKDEMFQPLFFYSGFQYALIEGIESPDPTDFEAVAIYSSLDYGSDFCCSNQMLNQFVRNTRWSQKSNFVDIPTDCPQREKSGWTGDAQLFTRTASYFADTAPFYRKWLRDVRDCQREDGLVMDVNPRIRGKGKRDSVNGSSGWADAAVIIPYTMWKLYNDDSFITDNYELMWGWAQYMQKLSADKSVFHLPEGHFLRRVYDGRQLPDSPWNCYMPECGVHWGEWVEPDFEGQMDSDPTLYLLSPKPEVTTAYLSYSMSLLEEMLRHIGETEKADICHEYAAGAKEGYRYHFIRDGEIHTDHMAQLVRPLALGLAEGEAAEQIAAQLNEMAVARNYTVGTGFLSTPFLLQTLAKFGYLDTAYKMLENTEIPGWLAMVKQGATTVWEQYCGYDGDGNPRSISMNHYSMGSVCSFLFDTVCGIRITDENEFLIAPKPGGTLTEASARYASPYGTVCSAWKRSGAKIEYKVSIPSNTTATFQLMNGEKKMLLSGKYQFKECLMG